MDPSATRIAVMSLAPDSSFSRYFNGHLVRRRDAAGRTLELFFSFPFKSFIIPSVLCGSSSVWEEG